MAHKHKKILTMSLLGVGFFLVAVISPAPARAAGSNLTNIMSPSTSWGWNAIIGWINFNTYGNITVSASQLTGYASSSVGPIALDCGTSPAPNCAGPAGNWKVWNASGTAEGNLSGWAWNDKIGWITFYWGNTSSSPASGCNAKFGYGSYCGVWVDQYGNFQGTAWSDVVGWIYFNNTGTGWNFSSSHFEVQTTWAPSSTTGVLDSATFDTGSPNGAALNSIMWQGSLNGCASCSVGFEFAVATSSSGPWNFGPTIYSGNPNTPIPISNYAAYSGYRYFRYRVILTTNTSQSISPTVTGVAVDWSP
jgi:hypothetical protein